MEKSQDILMMLSSPETKLISALAASALILGGCARFGGDAAALYTVAKRAWAGGGSVTLQEAAAVPYASIGVRLRGSDEAMLVLASDVGGRQFWTSAQRIVLVTQAGRLVRTAGLENNLGGSQLRIPSADNEAFTWLADFPDLSLYGIPIICQPHLKPPETITILGSKFRTIRIDEDCAADSDQFSWSFTNVFWRDPQSGFVWKSIQYFHPKVDPLTIEVLRPTSET